ncbi:MAG: hypothetical protein LCH57_01925 [Proteobacteria bacterium]|nr:hypothetical protein [Pseudomonadota bacterium]
MIEPAYQALASSLRTALLATDFIDSPDDLKVDPSATFSPSGDERVLVTAAALMKVRTASVRQLLGGPRPRHVVERLCQLELAAAGPDRLRRAFRIDDVLEALSAIPNADPTLGGAAERLVLGEQTDDDLPPNGVSFLVTFTIRVRSSDALGRTP